MKKEAGYVYGNNGRTQMKVQNLYPTVRQRVRRRRLLTAACSINALVLYFVSGKLCHIKGVVSALLFKQFIMIANFYYSALIHNYDLIGITYG